MTPSDSEQLISILKISVEYMICIKCGHSPTRPPYDTTTGLAGRKVELRWHKRESVFIMGEVGDGYRTPVRCVN
jgi:hypothetical protein